MPLSAEAVEAAHQIQKALAKLSRVNLHTQAEAKSESADKAKDEAKTKVKSPSKLKAADCRSYTEPSEASACVMTWRTLEFQCEDVALLNLEPHPFAFGRHRVVYRGAYRGARFVAVFFCIAIVVI